jgi:hypothetical protein
VINNEYLLIIGEWHGATVFNDLYHEGKYMRKVILNYKKPYQLLNEVEITFFGECKYAKREMMFCFSAPLSINIIRTEVLLKEKKNEASRKTAKNNGN